MLASCGKKSLEPVSEPSWYTNKTYFDEKNSLYEFLYVDTTSIVMLGDDIIDRGEWAQFYQDTCLKNRGISLEGTEHTLYRIDKIAQKQPKKIFVCSGMRDVKYTDSLGHLMQSKDIVDRIEQIMHRAQVISPNTQLYYISITPDGKMSDESIALAQEVNESVMAKAKKGNYTYIDAASKLCGDKKCLSEPYTWNGSNLNGAGYEVLANVLSEYVGDPALNKADDHKYPEITDYYQHRVSIFNSLPKLDKSVVFLGNSLCNNAQWSELIPVVHNVINRGISGDVVEGVYNRLDDIEEQKPILLFVMTGLNNFINDSTTTALSVWKTYEKIIKKVKEDMPTAQFCVLSTIPVSPISKFYNGINPKVYELNKLLLAGSKTYNYVYMDIAEKLSDENGDLDAKYTYDGIHLNSDGYFVWCTTIMRSGIFIGVRQAQENGEIKF